MALIRTRYSGLDEGIMRFGVIAVGVKEASVVRLLAFGAEFLLDTSRVMR